MKPIKRNLSISILAILALFCLGSFTCRVPYHRWRLTACHQTAERLRAGGYTRTDEFLNLFRREPKTYRDYEDAAARHEDALVKLNYLVRKEFRIRKPLLSDSSLVDFMTRATARFPDTNEWSLVVSPTGDVLRVTTRPNRIDEWETFIRDFDRASPGNDVRKCKGSRRRRHRLLNAATDNGSLTLAEYAAANSHGPFEF